MRKGFWTLFTWVEPGQRPNRLRRYKFDLSPDQKRRIKAGLEVEDFVYNGTVANFQEKTPLFGDKTLKIWDKWDPCLWEPVPFWLETCFSLPEKFYRQILGLFRIVDHGSLCGLRTDLTNNYWPTRSHKRRFFADLWPFHFFWVLHGFAKSILQ